MRFLKDTHIDFLGKRRSAAAISLLVIAIGVVSLVANGGPRLGIDFAGGTQIVVRFAQMPQIDEVRTALQAEGLDPTIQEFESDSSELLIRTPGSPEEDAPIDAAVQAVAAGLDRLLGEVDRTGIDLNTADPDEIVSVLLASNPSGYDLTVDPDGARADYLRQVDPIFQARAMAGLLTVWEQIETLGIDSAVFAVVRDNAHLGGYAVVDSQSVGPQVGQDLRSQAVQAIVWALVGMLAYISYRFEFKFAVAAVVALVHDVSIALGAFSLTGREFNLPVIAAFLTIVGYSLNDTVVIFDRIRENNSVLRKLPLYDRINTSLNQTLSRTLLTSTTTLVVVVSLFVYGGPVINDFSFALLIGVLVGTYSSLFVASPIVYVWQVRDAAKRR